MTMLHVADQRPAFLQTLATGRISERITRRGLRPTDAILELGAEAGPLRPVPARFGARIGGYFAFCIQPDRDLPDLSAVPQAMLRATFHLAARPPVVSERLIAGDSLSLVDQVRTIAGQDMLVRALATAAIDLLVEIDPTPVALQGVVLRRHDPLQPAAGVEVAAGPAQGLTDSGGWFFLPALPLLEAFDLVVTENGVATSFPFRPDYARPVNRATLSLPG